jgi:hypothetical protein
VSVRYTKEMADRDARLLELADARVQLARVLLMGPRMHCSPTWTTLRERAEARLQQARADCEDCWEIDGLLATQIRAVEDARTRS